MEHHARRSFVPDGSCPAWVLRYDHDGNVPFHDHAFHEMVLVQRGGALHRTPHHNHEVARRDALLVRPGMWHRYEVGKGGLGLANCLIDSGLFGAELAWLHDEPFLGAFLWSDPRNAVGPGFLHVSLAKHEEAALADAFAGIERAQTADGDPMRRTRIIAQMLLCFATLGDALARSAATAGTPPPLHGAVRAALHAMNTRMEEPWTVESLARQALNVSPSHLLGLFRSQLGQSPMAVLNRCRMERAAGLLVGTKMTIAEIGAAVGIDDPNYVARRFRQHFGMSPTDLRLRGQTPGQA
jgi:AraC family L-rhamnose operon transcriptional activator RhaR